MFMVLFIDWDPAALALPKPFDDVCDVVCVEALIPDRSPSIATVAAVLIPSTAAVPPISLL